jgi:quinol monooxygenase YgiN
MASDVTVGLLARLKAQPGKEAELEEFLRGAGPIVEGEPNTVAWFAIKLGDSEYGIFDVFPDDSGRQEHLNGQVAQALGTKGAELLAGEPSIEFVDVLAAKL